MITRAEVKAALLAVEKANGVIAFNDQLPAKVTREELRVLIEAAKNAQYQRRGQYDAVSDAEYFL